jgi:hypothetical protein
MGEDVLPTVGTLAEGKATDNPEMAALKSDSQDASGQ